MNDYARAGILILTIILVFGLSYIAVDHLGDVRVIKDSEEVVKLQAENDSLKTVIEDLSVSDSTEVPNE
jgi:hypothetical protein